MDENNYVWRMTGNPWLDGVIYGAGAPVNKYAILVNVGDLPIGIIEKILEKFNEIGYQADYKEIPNARTKKLDLKIEAIGPSPVFGDLPRYSQRRLTDDMPIEFLKGFFTAISVPKLSSYSMDYKNDGIYIRFPMPIDDLIYFLSKLGIEEYIESHNGIFLDIEVFDGIDPFDEIYRALKDEIIIFRIPPREEIIEETMNRIKAPSILSEILEKTETISKIIYNWDSYVKDYDIGSGSTYYEVIEQILDDDFEHVKSKINEDFSFYFSNLNSDFFIIRKEDLKKILAVYKKQLKQLFMKSTEFKIFLTYMEYCQKKQLLEPDFLVNPYALSQNTHVGNVELAKFFIIQILGGKFVKDFKNMYHIPLLREYTQEELTRLVVDSVESFLDNFKYFNLELSEEDIKKGVFNKMRRCLSCKQNLVLFSGEFCEFCKTPLCIECKNNYSFFDKNDCKKYFCKAHYDFLCNKSENNNINNIEGARWTNYSRKKTKVDILFYKKNKDSTEYKKI